MQRKGVVESEVISLVYVLDDAWAYFWQCCVSPCLESGQAGSSMEDWPIGPWLTQSNMHISCSMRPRGGTIQSDVTSACIPAWLALACACLTQSDLAASKQRYASPA